MKKFTVFILLLCFLSCDERSSGSLEKKTREIFNGKGVIKDLEEQTLISVKNEFIKKGWKQYEVENITLVHRSDNEYSGILSYKLYGQEASIPLTVIYDGTNLIWHTK